MKYTIQPKRHRAFPPPLGIYRKRRSFRRSVVFLPSCRYHMEGVDYFDVHKLFGFGYLSGGHHRDSARFGWRYDESNDRISLYAYTYVNGERSIKHMACVPIDREVQLEIFIDYNHQYWFEVKVPDNPFFTTRSYSIPFSHKKQWKYALGPYFGGTSTAPQRISLLLKSLDK
jgi:hypothetical protein